jgi:hypothetical protein
MEGDLGSLHSLLCAAYRRLLVDEEGEPRTEIDARVLGHINKFLADNKIKQIAEPGNDISELDMDLQKRKKRFGKDNITDIATERAKKEAIG